MRRVDRHLIGIYNKVVKTNRWEFRDNVAHQFSEEELRSPDVNSWREILMSVV